MPILQNAGLLLARFLSTRRHVHSVNVAIDDDRLIRILRPGDVLLVDGDTIISTGIKYLTQSAWSHAALFVGSDQFPEPSRSNHCFVEADVVAGVRSVGVGEYSGRPTRICRPVGLSDDERAKVVDHVVTRIGHRYDLRNVFDLARYLIPTPPVPTRFRRRLIGLGSGDPTRAICSTLIAQAFQSIGYPILPTIERRPAPTAMCPGCFDEIMRIRHHSLFTPSDFDASPYFRIVKPAIEDGFDFRCLDWAAAEIEPA